MSESTTRRPEAAMATRIEALQHESMSAIPTALVSLATTLSFIQVFGTWDYFWPMAMAALIVHGWGILLRALRLPVALSLVAPTLSVIITIGWLRYGNSLWFGLPLRSTWSAMTADFRAAWNLVGEVVTPVAFVGEFGSVSLFVIGFVAAATDSFAARYGGRVEVFVPAAATLFIVATVGTGQDRLEISTGWFMTAVLATFLIRRDRRRHVRSVRRRSVPRDAAVRSVIGVAVFVTSVGAAAYMLGPLLPGAGDEAWLTQRTQGGARELQPLVDVRRRLTDPSATVLFTVQADAASYWRVTSLADFDGSTWTISQQQLDAAAGSLSPPDGSDDPGVESVINFQRFTIDSLAGSLVPVAATPTRLRSSTQSLFYEPESGTLLMGEGGTRNRDVYEIDSTMISPTPERLAIATVMSPPSDAYLALPDDDMVARVRDIARSIAPAELSPYQQALALQDYFRSQFTYTLDVPPLDGSNATLEFLERRSGYCEHFSSTFALFARTLGLPARVAIGFTPGDRSPTNSGPSVFTVRSSHAHAWPEVWFDGLGWVLFEPTPGRGAPNSSYTNVPEEQSEPESTPTTTNPPTTTTTTTPFNTPTTGSEQTSNQEITGSVNRQSSGRSIWLSLLGCVVLLIAMWMTMMPRLMRLVVRRRNDPPVLLLWRRAIALYELERGSFDPSLSPHELATQATSRLYNDDTFIFELAQRACEYLYGQSSLSPAEIADLTENGRDYLTKRRRRLTWQRRLRASVDPLTVWKLEGGWKLRGWRQPDE